MESRRERNGAWTRPLLFVALSLAALGAWAAPAIRSIKDVNHNYGQVGEWLMIEGEGFNAATSTSVFFSKSGGGTVASTEVMNSYGRGMILCTVPATAVTGTVAVQIDGGALSPGYPFTVNPGTFDPGANTVTGKVTASSVAVQNCAVVLLTPLPCDEGMGFWDAALTNSLGNYSLNWPGSGPYMLFLFPARSSNLAGTSLSLAGTGNIVQNVALTAGTTVTGKVVNASATAVSGAAVDWEGDAYDKVMTDASGNFSIHVAPGDWRMSVDPPLNYHAIGIDESPVTVPATTPYALGNQTLGDGVWISGVLQDDTAAKIASADLLVNPQNGGNPLNWGTSGIGGVFGLEVPLNTALQLNVTTNRLGPWVDYQANIGPFSSDTVLGTITLVRAGFVTGVVRDEGGTPLSLVGLSLVRADNGTYLDWTDTCEDGSFILKAPSVGTTVPVRATVQFWQDNRPYAVQTYNDKLFLCEGDILDVSGTGTVSGIDFYLHPGGSFSGTVSTYSGGAPLSNMIVVADDGSPHDCSLGGWPSTDGGGFYQNDHMPTVPLRVWVTNAGSLGYSTGSYNNKIYPQYTSFTPTAGTVTPNINIGLANPVQPKAVPDGKSGTQAAKLWKLDVTGNLLQGTWDVTTCPPPFNHDYNLLVGVGSTLSSYGVVGSQCGLGRTGTFTGAMPDIPAGETFFWFLVVQSGGNGSTEGSWGRNSLNQERGTGPSNQCEYTGRDTSAQCP